MKNTIAMFLPFCLAALLIIVNACDSRAQAAAPAQRLARQLPPAAAARAAARREYAAALRALFRTVGIVEEATATETISARAAAISAVAAAISNRAEVASAVRAERAEIIARENLGAPPFTIPVPEPVPAKK